MACRLESRDGSTTMEAKGKENRQEHVEGNTTTKCRNQTVGTGSRIKDPELGGALAA